MVGGTIFVAGAVFCVMAVATWLTKSRGHLGRHGPYVVLFVGLALLSAGIVMTARRTRGAGGAGPSDEATEAPVEGDAVVSLGIFAR